MILFIVAAFLLAFILSYLSLPPIITISHLKNITDHPDDQRKSHKSPTPTVGGITFFFCTLFVYALFLDYFKWTYIPFLIPSMTLIFIAGLKDDITAMKPWRKLVMQSACAVLLTVFGSIHISSLWGIMGITDIPNWLGITLTFLIILTLINAFNLIDGVDGLAGVLGLIGFLFFGGWFFLVGQLALSVLAFAMAGSIVGFLFYNFSPAKIFMGDTGAMMVGFILSVLAINFIEVNRSVIPENSVFYIKAAPAVAVSVLIVPLFDLIRLFFVRLMQKRNPFSADRNHIHHLLTLKGYSANKTVLILGLVEISLIILSLVLKDIRSYLLMIILILVYTFIHLALKKVPRQK